MIKFRLILLFCVGVGLLGCVPARAKASERYVLRWKTAKLASSASDKWDVWLWDSKRKRVLWKRRMDSFSQEAVHWSKDRRALAIECTIVDSSDKTPRRVLVWREGYRLRDFRVPDGDDYTMGCAWSPDKRRLLVLGGSSGDSQLVSGHLSCLELQVWPNYQVFKVGHAHRFLWKNRKTVVYQDFVEFPDAHKPIPLAQSRIWHAP